jgi:hypothetical protein
LDKDGKDYMQTFSKSADAKMYYPATGSRRDGSMNVMFSATKDPGKIENHEDDGTSPGYSGIDR